MHGYLSEALKLLMLPVVQQQLRVSLIFLENVILLESRVWIVSAVVKIADQGKSELLFDLRMVCV